MQEAPHMIQNFGWWKREPEEENAVGRVFKFLQRIEPTEASPRKQPYYTPLEQQYQAPSLRTQTPQPLSRLQQPNPTEAYTKTPYARLDSGLQKPIQKPCDERHLGTIGRSQSVGPSFYYQVEPIDPLIVSKSTNARAIKDSERHVMEQSPTSPNMQSNGQHIRGSNSRLLGSRRSQTVVDENMLLALLRVKEMRGTPPDLQPELLSPLPLVQPLSNHVNYGQECRREHAENQAQLFSYMPQVSSLLQAAQKQAQVRTHPATAHVSPAIMQFSPQNFLPDSWSQSVKSFPLHMSTPYMDSELPAQLSGTVFHNTEVSTQTNLFPNGEGLQGLQNLQDLRNHHLSELQKETQHDPDPLEIAEAFDLFEPQMPSSLQSGTPPKPYIAYPISLLLAATSDYDGKCKLKVKPKSIVLTLELTQRQQKLLPFLPENFGSYFRELQAKWQKVVSTLAASMSEALGIRPLDTTYSHSMVHPLFYPTVSIVEITHEDVLQWVILERLRNSIQLIPKHLLTNQNWTTSNYNEALLITRSLSFCALPRLRAMIEQNRIKFAKRKRAESDSPSQTKKIQQILA